MTASIKQQIAASRPRIKPDVEFARTAAGVVVHDCTAGFHVTSPFAYRIACALVPRLTGDATVADLCQGLSEGQRELVGEMIAAMLDRGLASDAQPAPAGPELLAAPVADRFASHIKDIHHRADQAGERFSAFRSARVAVLGNREAARWCVLGLLRCGAASIAAQRPAEPGAPVEAELATEVASLTRARCPAEVAPLADGLLSWRDLSRFDLIAVTSGRRQLAALAGPAVPVGAVVLSAGVLGVPAGAGQPARSGRSGRTDCAVLRFGAGDDPGAAADLWSRLVAPAASAPSRPLGATLGNLLAHEVFRLGTAARRSDTGRDAAAPAHDSIGTGAVSLLPHPACPACGGAEVTAVSAPDGVAGLVRRIAAPADGDGAEDPEGLYDELTRHSLLIRPSIELITAFGDEEATRLPPGASRIRVCLGRSERPAGAAFDVRHGARGRLTA